MYSFSRYLACLADVLEFHKILANFAFFAVTKLIRIITLLASGRRWLGFG